MPFVHYDEMKESQQEQYGKRTTTSKEAKLNAEINGLRAGHAFYAQLRTVVIKRPSFDLIVVGITIGILTQLILQEIPDDDICPIPVST